MICLESIMSSLHVRLQVLSFPLKKECFGTILGIIQRRNGEHDFPRCLPYLV